VTDGSSHISSIATPLNQIVHAATEEGEVRVVLAVVVASEEGAEETAWLEKVRRYLRRI
jgi:hypothetical protein